MDKQRFIIRDKGIKHNAVQAVQCITGDPLMVVEVKPYRKSKTAEQLGYACSVVFPTIRQHVEDAGLGSFSDDDVYQDML